MLYCLTQSVRGDPSRPVSFRGPTSCAGIFNRYRHALFRHGQPRTPMATGTATAAATTIDVAVEDCGAALGLRANESYTLAVANGTTTISIEAPTQLGAIHALETLAQLVSWDPALGGGDGGYTIPGGVRIVDAPRFPHRELMVDCARFFLPAALLEAVVDAMVTTKLNVLHLHASDSESMPIAFKSRPEFAQIAFSPGERYTMRELARLAAFAAARGVRLIVELDVPSHTGTLAYTGAPGWCTPFPAVCPKPACHHNALNPAIDLTYEIIDDLMGELASALGPSSAAGELYLHLGGDELLQDAYPPHTCWQQDPSITAWMNATFSPPGRDPRGFGGAVAYMNDRLETMLASKHRMRAIRWEEAFYYSCCDSPTTDDPCPGGFRPGCKTRKETLVHHWRSGAAWSGELVKLTTSNGYDMISSAGFYLPGNASEMWAIDICAGIDPAACRAHVLGGGAALWQADPSTVISSAFGHAPVVAGVLWQGGGSGAYGTGTREPWAGGAELRLQAFRCHLADRGVAAAPLGAPRAFGSCAR